ncbi:aminoglycoside phosphotransferase family protein [Kocuria sp. M1N1S27]|uniref:aminoglycoside phosphotransferase family protein n=1 Tax=Kocuria kalidii TaxID=3376283 RepID=UPI003792FFFF
MTTSSGSAPGPDAAAGDRSGLAARYTSAWELVPDGRARDDGGALILPVRTRAGEPAVLRLSPPRSGAEHEHLALRLWGGRGAVRLLRAEPADRALLLERTADHDLHALPVLEACRVLGELTRALARPPRPPFPRLSAAARRWREDLAGATELDARFPRRFRLQAVKNLERLLRGELDTALVHQDLHHGAVRAAQRSPWLATGADPVLGTPEFALVPALWRRTEQAGQGGALAAALEDRIEALSIAAGADPERLRAWALVRFAVAARAGTTRPTGAPHGELSRLVQLCKAVQRGA